MAVVIKRFESPDEARVFSRGAFDVVGLGAVTIGRARYEPGWVWSRDVGSALGASMCEVRHAGLVLQGRAMVRMQDGTEHVLEPGDLFQIEGAHDSWVVGDEPYVSLHLLGAAEYAR